jgi:predicted metal-dependent hydrolase
MGGHFSTKKIRRFTQNRKNFLQKTIQKDSSQRIQRIFAKRELRTIGKENRRFFGKNIESDLQRIEIKKKKNNFEGFKKIQKTV